MKTAIVHYWLVNMRGGEKMLEALLEMFPGADIYTHVYNPDAVSEKIKSRRIYTSYINKLPFARRLYQTYMPLMPRALLDFNLQGYDLVISSEAGPAKGVVPSPAAYHLCYCHTPMRYIWDMYHEYFQNSNPLTRFFMKRIIPSLRLWDISSANMVDRFVTNSNFVAARIRRYYHRKADVVFGPVPVEKYLPLERAPEDFYLFLGQINGYKRLDIAVDACITSGRKLVIAGAGAKKKDIKRWKKSGLISYRGRISDEEAGALYSRARALLFPGIEDLGLVPIEANAAGCPVIAFRGGGALDTIVENKTGVFFDEQNSTSLLKAILQFEATEDLFKDRNFFTAHVRLFSKEAFIERMRNIIKTRAAI
jgi:glycosyltransferase involved in cell wall biosynthesis